MTRARTILVATLLSVFVSASAQTPLNVALSPATDATWARSFAVPFDPQHSPKFQGMLITDPRFLPLLKASFPQHQWFWSDHDRPVAMDQLIYTFLGVSFGDPILDEGRYITANGCVAHVCNVDQGMLWIDSEVHPASLIFAATNLLSGNGPEGYHLWIFSSTNLNWQQLSPSFSASLRRWLANTGSTGTNFKFDLVTIVQPNGIMEDLSPETLPLGTRESGTTETGAKQ